MSVLETQTKPPLSHHYQDIKKQMKVFPLLAVLIAFFSPESPCKHEGFLLLSHGLFCSSQCPAGKGGGRKHIWDRGIFHSPGHDVQCMEWGRKGNGWTDGICLSRYISNIDTFIYYITLHYIYRYYIIYIMFQYVHWPWIYSSSFSFSDAHINSALALPIFFIPFLAHFSSSELTCGCGLSKPVKAGSSLVNTFDSGLIPDLWHLITVPEFSIYCSVVLALPVHFRHVCVLLHLHFPHH